MFGCNSAEGVYANESGCWLLWHWVNSWASFINLVLAVSLYVVLLWFTVEGFRSRSFSRWYFFAWLALGVMMFAVVASWHFRSWTF